jgi:hypothetical protein
MSEAAGTIGTLKVSPYKMSRHEALTLILEMVELRKMAVGA